jgi:hypothetical protein
MVKTITLLFGAILALVGLVGFFIPSPLFGIFEVNALHNAIHLATGALLLGVGFFSPQSSRMTLGVFGIIYAIVAVLGFVMPGDTILGLIPSNTADDGLHTLLALVFLYGGFMTESTSEDSMGSAMSNSM